MRVILFILIALNIGLAGLALRSVMSGPRSGSTAAPQGTTGQWLLMVLLLGLDIALMVFLIARDYRFAFHLLGVLHLLAAVYVFRRK